MVGRTLAVGGVGPMEPLLVTRGSGVGKNLGGGLWSEVVGVIKFPPSGVDALVPYRRLQGTQRCRSNWASDEVALGTR